MLTLWKVKLKHKRVRCCSIVGTDGFGMQFRCAACSGGRCGGCAGMLCPKYGQRLFSAISWQKLYPAKKGQRHNRHSRRNPRCGLPCRRIGKWVHLRYISVETAHLLRTLQRYLICRMNNLTYCCTLVHDSSRSPNWDNACEHYIFGMRRILI